MKLVLVLLMLVLVATALAVPGDVDDDGVKDEFDRCADTVNTIVNPLKYVDYAGCSCNQLKFIIDTTNPCLQYYCVDEVLEMSEIPNCDAEQTQALISLIDYVPEFGTMNQEFAVNGATVLLSDPVMYQKVELDQELFIEAFVIFDKDDPRSNRSLTLKKGSKVIPQEVISGEIDDGVFSITQQDFSHQFSESLFDIPEEYAGKNIVFGYSRWSIPSDNIGQSDYRLEYGYTGESNEHHVSSFNNPLRVVVVEEIIPRVYDKKLIGTLENGQLVLTDNEETFVKAVYDEMVRQGIISSYNLNTIKDNVARALRAAQITKGAQGQVATISIEPDGYELYDVRVIEFIPKNIAESVAELTFSQEPIIIKDDPLIMWHFDEVEERVDLSYEAEREVALTGNTIVTAEEIVQDQSSWGIILPLIIIPLIIIIAVFILRKKK